MKKYILILVVIVTISMSTALASNAHLETNASIVEYIEKYYEESHNYIDLGVSFKENTRIQIKFYPTNGGGGAILGDKGGGSDSNDWRFFFYGSILYYDFDNSRKSASKNLNTLYEWEIGNYYIKELGATNNILSGTAHTDFSYRVSSMRLGQGSKDFIRVYYVKIFEGETLIKDFVPCYEEGAYGLWDKIEGKLYLPKNGVWTGSAIDNDETGTPDNDETGTQDNEETGTPDNDETGTPDNEETGTPDNEETGTPDNDETGTPIWRVVKMDGTVIDYPAGNSSYVTIVGDYMTEHDYVDLELPSGTLWATMNVGASKPEDYGEYFAWGETGPKSKYNWDTYKWKGNGVDKFSKYCDSPSWGIVDNKIQLDREDDVAYANWGKGWRMPTKEQWEELISKCTWIWKNKNGVNGFEVHSNLNTNSIFLPAAGWHETYSIYEDGEQGYYWSRRLYSNSSRGVWYIYFIGDDGHEMSIASRYTGYSVRPVRFTE